MPRMRVLRLVVHAPTHQPVLLLGEVDGERFVPVFVRRPQADLIDNGPRGANDPLLTQDLIGPIVRGLSRTLDLVEITELRDGAFHVDLVFDTGTRIAAPSSDALALAVRDGIPISMAAAILDEVGQPITDLFPHGGGSPNEEQLREFSQFVEQVSPDDFRDPPASGSPT